MLRITIFFAAAIACQAQFFGGRTPNQNGGFNQQAGYRAGPAWGSVSQNVHRVGSDPIVYSGGLDFASQRGHGLSGSISAVPGVGGQGTARGTVGLPGGFSTFGQHDRNLNKNLRPIGPATNTFGVNYQNPGGASAFAARSKTAGFPGVGTVGGSIPIINKPNTQLNLNGQSTFAHGMRPNHQIGLQFQRRF